MIFFRAVIDTTHHEDGRIVDHISRKSHSVVPLIQDSVQRPGQEAARAALQAPQTLHVVHEHEEIIQQERPRMVARAVGGRVVHEHAAGGVIHHGHKGVRQVGHYAVDGPDVAQIAGHQAPSSVQGPPLSPALAGQQGLVPRLVTTTAMVPQEQVPPTPHSSTLYSH
jgi:hypothetical protein